MTNYKLISTNVIFNLTEVRLYEETIAHIRDEHPEVPIQLPSIYRAVENAIVNPTHVELGHDGSYIFVDAETTNASGDPLRVPVKPVDGNSGRVRTVYFASRTGTPNIVWRRQ